MGVESAQLSQGSNSATASLMLRDQETMLGWSAGLAGLERERERAIRATSVIFQSSVFASLASRNSAFTCHRCPAVSACTDARPSAR